MGTRKRGEGKERVSVRRHLSVRVVRDPRRVVALVERTEKDGDYPGWCARREGSRTDRRSGCVSHGARRVGVSEDGVGDGLP